MTRLLRSSVVVLVAHFATAGLATAGDTESVAAASFLPSDVTVAIGLRNGDRHAAAFRTLLDETGFYDSQTYRSFFRTPQVLAARVGLSLLAASSGTDEWGAVRAALGRDLAIGIRMDGGPQLLGVIVARDAEVVELLASAIQDYVDAESVGAYEGAAGEERHEIYSAKGRAFLVFTGDALLVSSHRGLLTDALDARFGRKPSFGESAAYRDVAQTVPSDAAAWGWLDVDAAREQLERAGKWPSRIAQPLAGFVAGGWWHHLSSAKQAIAWALPTPERTIDLQLRVDGAKPLPETHHGFLSGAFSLGWSATELPRYVADLMITRDWADLFSEREELLDRAGVGDLSKFLTNVGNFLGNLDLVDDVLPKMTGAARVVVAEQTYPAATPTPALPAFALVAPLSDPAGKLSRQLEKAAQVAFTFINYQAMQQKRPTFMMETGRYRDFRVLSTFFDEVPSKPTVRFNFQPAVGRIGNYYVIATSKVLLEDIADRILGATPGEAKPRPDVLSVDGRAIARLLRLNREALITNRMLEVDAGRREAARFVDGLVSVLDFVGGLRVEATTGSTRSELGVALRLVPLARSRAPKAVVR